MPPLTPDLILSASDADALRNERVVIPIDDALFHVQGIGALSCIQGLLTNDVVKPLNGRAMWGAVLTPKGMIISDLWILRADPDLWIVAPARARATMTQLFGRTMPPRLARVTDRSDTMRVVVSIGGMLDGAHLFVPEGAAPFGAMQLLERDAPLPDGRTLTAVAFDVAKAAMGWPVLGREIDDRTLPQEVRFDELGGVKYDKGCYTGQETVARLHFRGHANRKLVGIEWNADAAPTDRELMLDGKSVGTVRTIAAAGSAQFATAVLRREVEMGATMNAGDVQVHSTEFPIALRR